MTMRPITLATLAILAAPVAMAGGEATFETADQVQFEDILPGVVAFATVVGDRTSGAHGTFVRIPAGQSTPMHTHGAGYHAVVIEGHFENPTEGVAASTVTLKPGSHYHVPAGAAHVSRCAETSPTDCLTFFYQETAFDFAPVE